MNKAEEYYKKEHRADYTATVDSGFLREYSFDYWMNKMEAYHQSRVNAISDEMKNRYKNLELKLKKAKDEDNIYDYITGAKLLEVGNIIDKLNNY